MRGNGYGGPSRTMRALKSRTRREILADLGPGPGRRRDRRGLRPDRGDDFRTPRRASSSRPGRDDEGGHLSSLPGQASSPGRSARGARGRGKWRPADEIPERALTATSTASVVVAEVDLLTPPETTFSALTDAELYSRWLQVPVTIEDGEFAATLEWGTEVRGRYEFVIPPHLIVMGWDFDDGNVPIPGRPLTGYLRVHPDGHGSRVVVHHSSTLPIRRRSWKSPGPWSSDVSKPTSWPPSPDRLHPNAHAVSRTRADRRLMRPTLLRRDSDPERPWTPPGKRRDWTHAGEAIGRRHGGLTGRGGRGAERGSLGGGPNRFRSHP